LMVTQKEAVEIYRLNKQIRSLFREYVT